MFEELADVKELIAVLNKVKEVTIIKKDRLDDELFMHCLDALGYIAENDIYDLKHYIYELLECPNAIIRGDAVATLGFSTRLGLPEFKDMAYKIWLNDPNEDVKFTALSSWAGYFIDTKNKEVITIFYKILTNEKHSMSIRAMACADLFATVEHYHPAFDRYADYDLLNSAKSNDEFNRRVNWNAVNELMLEYAPEAIEKQNK